jgi:hypothetical protein
MDGLRGRVLATFFSEIKFALSNVSLLSREAI